MVAWQFLCIVGIIFLILEMFTPSMFFLNFALASFITAVFSLFTASSFSLVIIFFVLSFASFIFLRPMLLKRNSKDILTGIDEKYIGNVAKVIENVSEFKGAITIYGERWDARTLDSVEILAGSEVKIVKNDGLTMYVERFEN